MNAHAALALLDSERMDTGFGSETFICAPH